MQLRDLNPLTWLDTPRRATWFLVISLCLIALALSWGTR